VNGEPIVLDGKLTGACRPGREAQVRAASRRRAKSIGRSRRMGASGTT
jgi:hypothetical protein